MMKRDLNYVYIYSCPVLRPNIVEMYSLLCLILFCLSYSDHVVADGILRINFHSLMQESNALDIYCDQDRYFCRIEASYCVRFGNSSMQFKCNSPNIELNVSAYAYKGNNKYGLQFDATQTGSDSYFELQTNDSFNGTFEIYSKINTYGPSFVKELYYSAYFRGRIQPTDSIMTGIIQGMDVLQQVNTTFYYELNCAAGYTGMYCNIECSNEACPLTNRTNDFSPVIISPSDMSTVTVNLSVSSYTLVSCVVFGESVESYWLDSSLQPVSNDNFLFIGLQILYRITEPTPFHCIAFNNHGLVNVTIYIHVVGGNRSRIETLSDLSDGISNEENLNENDLAYINEYLLYATDQLYGQLEYDYTVQLSNSGQNKYEFDDSYNISDEYYTELYELSSTYNNLVHRFTKNYDLLQQQSVARKLLNTANGILRVSNKPGIRLKRTTASIQNTNPLSNQALSITGATSKAYDALEFISLNFADNIENMHDIDTFLLSYESISVYARSWTRSGLTDNQYIYIPEYQPQITEQIQIPVELINQFGINRDKFSIAATFVDSHDYDSFEAANTEDSQIASRLIQIVLPSNYTNASKTLFPTPIRINFNATTLNNTEYQFTCVFLNKTSLEWSTNNVYIGNITNTSMVTCFTKHLTSFAVLVTPFKIPTNTIDYTVNRYISYTLGSLSFVLLLLSLILFIAAGKDFFKIEANIVYFNSCLAMFFAMTLYVFASQTFTFNVYLCKAVAFLLHYTWLALFFWMFCIGLLILYSITIGTLRKRRIYPFLFIIGWLLPIIIPIVTLGVGFNNYIDENPQHCFLHFSLIYAFIGPVFVIIFLNFIILCITLCRIFYALKKTNNFKSSEISKKTIITGFTLTPILGLPWSVTILGIFIHHPVIGWIHAFLSGSLGIVFFFVVVLQNDEVQALLWKSRARKRRLSKKTLISSNSTTVLKHRPRARSNKQTEECLNQSQTSLESNSISKSPTVPTVSEVYTNNPAKNEKERKAMDMPTSINENINSK